jgi:hypothetical protein
MAPDPERVTHIMQGIKKLLDLLDHVDPGPDEMDEVVRTVMRWLWQDSGLDFPTFRMLVGAKIMSPEKHAKLMREAGDSIPDWAAFSPRRH